MTVKPSVPLLWIVALCFVPICGLPAVVSGGERYMVCCAGALILLGLADLAWSRQNLGVFTVHLPEQLRTVLGEAHSFPVEVRNRKIGRVPKKLRLALSLPLEVSGVLDDVILKPPNGNEAVIAEMKLNGQKRGEFLIDTAVIGCASTLRLWYLQRTVSVRSNILVQPRLRQIWRETAKLLAAKRHGGQRIVARNGRGREFAQLREYVPSDDFGDVDWKATARRRSPVVREYQVERTQDIYACIDFSRLSGRQVSDQNGMPVSALDEYIRSTLMLSCAVRETGDHLGLITFSNRLARFVKAAPPTGLDQVFRTALFPLATEMVSPAFDEVCVAIRMRAKRRALIFFFTNLSEPHLAESFTSAAQLLARQHLVVAGCLADPYTKPLFSGGDVEDVEQVYREWSGHLLWKRMALLRLQLASSGIRMHIAKPERLGWTATEEYLQIKERQLL